MSETKYWRTLHGSHRHTTFYCANKHRAIMSGDCFQVTAEEADAQSLAPCAECFSLTEIQEWAKAKAIKDLGLCRNSGVVNPKRIYSTCRDCGKEGKVNRGTGTIKGHKPIN